MYSLRVTCCDFVAAFAVLPFPDFPQGIFTMILAKMRSFSLLLSWCAGTAHGLTAQPWSLDRPFPRFYDSYAQPTRYEVTAESSSHHAGTVRPRQHRIFKVPAVDSTLLRFLGTQRAQQQQELQQITTTDVITETATTSETISDAPALTKDGKEGTPWQQYNQQRVAAALREHGGADPAVAACAGEQVQAHVLERTARRRLREFLRHRNRYDGENGLVQAPEYVQYTLEDSLTVLLAHGLTAADVAEVLCHTPSVVLMRPCVTAADDDAQQKGETLADTLQRTLALLCDTLHLRKYDARKIIRCCPGLLTMHGSRAAAQVVSMMTHMNVSTNSLSRDKTALPVLLSRRPDDLFRLAAFLSSDVCRMSISNVGPLLRRAQCQELLNAVAPAVSLSRQPDENDVVGLQQLRQEHKDATYRRMAATAHVLRDELGTGADLGRVIAAYPTVLLLDASTQILPAARYLMNDLGIWKDDLARVLQLYPALLGMQVQDMQQVVDFMTKLGISDRDSLATIFRSFPHLLTMSVERDMQPVVQFLRNEIGISNVGRFITRLPPVLGYSMDELTSKWRYLQRVVTDPRYEAASFPAYFSYPLERVIKTRCEYLRQVKRMPTQMVRLDHVVCVGDRDFAIKVCHDKDHGQAFRQFAEGRRQQQHQSPTKKRRIQQRVRQS